MTNEHKTCTVVVMVSVILLWWWQDLWTNIHNKIGLKRNGHSNLTLEKDGFFENSDVQPESEGSFVAQTLWWTETLCFLPYNPASSGPLICIQKKKKKNCAPIWAQTTAPEKKTCYVPRVITIIDALAVAFCRSAVQLHGTTLCTATKPHHTTADLHCNAGSLPRSQTTT